MSEDDIIREQARLVEEEKIRQARAMASKKGSGKVFEHPSSSDLQTEDGSVERRAGQGQ